MQKLMRVCGLKLHPQDMYKPDQKPRDVGLNELKEKLQNLLDVSNRSVYLTMSGVFGTTNGCIAGVLPNDHLW